MQHFSITKALVLNNNGELLQLRRSPSDNRRPGQWDVPGGQVDPGEDIMQALVREIREEAGVNVTVPQLGLVYATSKAVDGKAATWTFFVVQLDHTPEVQLSFEHDEYRWLPPQQALDGIEYDLHKDMLRYVLANDLLGAEHATDN